MGPAPGLSVHILVIFLDEICTLLDTAVECVLTVGRNDILDKDRLDMVEKREAAACLARCTRSKKRLLEVDGRRDGRTDR